MKDFKAVNGAKTPELTIITWQQRQLLQTKGYSACSSPITDAMTYPLHELFLDADSVDKNGKPQAYLTFFNLDDDDITRNCKPRDDIDRDFLNDLQEVNRNIVAHRTFAKPEPA
jgi:hypothetical protein